MKKYFVFILLVFSQYLSVCYESIFDKVSWIKTDKKNETNLYIQKEKNVKINFYKAEKTVTQIKGDVLIKNLLDFNNYTKIFPRTVNFKIIKDFGSNIYLIYSVMDFRPFKKRDYYVILKYNYVQKNENDYEFILEWYPVSLFEINIPLEESKDCFRVNNIYGRWTVKSYNNNGTYLSVEYHNDFILNVPNNLLTEFEKPSTINAINLLLKYSADK